MLPKTRPKEFEHRKRKRQMEIGIIIENITSILKRHSCLINKNNDILEFGSGNGFQIPYLQGIGNVVASDTYTSDAIKSLQDIEFVKFSITNTPFSDGQFDIIFSNHVIEHINDITSAFSEMQRIGKSSCIYAFSVPTNIWLLLSIPAQYYNKLRKIISMLSLKLTHGDSRKINRTETKPDTGKRHKTDSKVIKFLRIVMPRGHGVVLNFIKCYSNFKIKNWQQLYSDNGFSVIAVKPLLLYGPSEWPIIPTSRCRTNLCSSVLFLMKKQN